VPLPTFHYHHHQLLPLQKYSSMHWDLLADHLVSKGHAGMGVAMKKAVILHQS
jgi:hypothetical protein